MAVTFVPPPHSAQPVCRIAQRSDQDNQRIRDKLRIVTLGDDIAPPIPHFAPMRLPKATLAALKADGIDQPTPIQAQGLPVILSGRDCVGISYTGSGKTLVFALPMLLMALQVLPPTHSKLQQTVQ